MYPKIIYTAIISGIYELLSRVFPSLRDDEPPINWS